MTTEYYSAKHICKDIIFYILTSHFEMSSTNRQFSSSKRSEIDTIVNITNTREACLSTN